MNYSTYKKVPTLEYCKITRAAELLDCSVDDLLYWAEERKIKICIKVQDLKGMLVVPAISEPEQLLMFLCDRIFRLLKHLKINVLWLLCY